MKIKFLAIVLAFISAAGAIAGDRPDGTPEKQVWEFKDLKGWTLSSQDDNPKSQTSLVSGCLKIFTRAGSTDRKKVHTEKKIYTTGRYKWKTYVPPLGKGDQSSVGSWIYCDDKHEIDFEVGYGKKAVRQDLKAKAEDLVAYITTQGGPYSSRPVLIKPGWHTFEIDLEAVNGKYKTQWFIDGKLKHAVQQDFGPEIAFYIFCSVENLGFIGDQPATKDNYGLFDRVEYTWHP